MGLFSAWSSSPKPEDSKSKEAYEAPDRLSRAKCWDSRDAYFRCLDKNNILDAIGNKEVADKLCTNESQVFEQNCASSWVSWPTPPCSQKAAARCMVGAKGSSVSMAALSLAGSDVSGANGCRYRCSTSNNAGWLNTKRSNCCKGKKQKAPSGGRVVQATMQDRYRKPGVFLEPDRRYVAPNPPCGMGLINGRFQVVGTDRVRVMGRRVVVLAYEMHLADPLACFLVLT
jgi:cytochrome c oxidase assembly factor 6